MGATAAASFAWLLRGALVLATLTLFAGSAVAAKTDPLTFLRQVQSAARTLDYAGIYVYQQGSYIQTARLVHLVDGTGEHERLEVLDGEPHECLRANGTERCLQPERKVVVVQPARSDHFPGLLLGSDESVIAHYEWKPLPRGYRVAGRDCAVSELIARDHLRYSYRICTDLKTHLLLKAQTLDLKGHLIDQVSFGSIRMGKDVSPELLASHWDTKGWREQNDSSQPVDLGRQGWRFSLPSGFQPVAELSRRIGPDDSVDQLVLSDGLAAISIFIETFDPNRDQNVRQGSMRQGAVNIYRMRLASYWLTAVGEVPAQTVRNITEAVQYVPQSAR